MKFKGIEIYKIKYEAKREKVYLKVGGGVKIKPVATEKGIEQISKKIFEILTSKKVDSKNTFLRVFNHSRMKQLLEFGNDRAEFKMKRKFDLKEWELYSFRLIRDYMYQNKKGEFLDGPDGVVLSKSKIRNFDEFQKNQGGFRKFYGVPPDKEVLDIYRKIIEKYKYLDREKSKLGKLYYDLKKVEKEFPKGSRGHQPEFFLTEKNIMKKKKLMRDDVTFAFVYSKEKPLGYILGKALTERVTDNNACIVVYKDLIPLLPRVTKGGFNNTSFYGFKHEDKKKCVVALFILEPIIKK